MQKEYKQIDFFVEEMDSEQRIIKGYASTWDVDSVDDRIDPKAFDDTIKNNFLAPIERKGSPDIRFCREHSHRDVIGRINDLQVTPKGLYLEAYISETQLGDDTYTLLKDKALDRLSIGFTVENNKDISYEGNIRVIKKLRLYEISVVTFPANEKAEVFSVKSTDGIVMNRFEEFFSSLSDEDQERILGNFKSFLTPIEVAVEETPVEEEKASPESAKSICPTCGQEMGMDVQALCEEKTSDLEDEFQKLEEYFTQESKSFEVIKSLNKFESFLEGYLTK